MEEQCDHHWVTDVQLGRYYECEICGMIFPKNKLRKKKTYKLKKQTIECKVCGKPFTDKTTLCEHYDTIHNQGDEE